MKKMLWLGLGLLVMVLLWWERSYVGFSVYTEEETRDHMTEFRRVFVEIEAGEHLPKKSDVLVIPDAKSAGEAMISHFNLLEDKTIKIRDHRPFEVGYYKGVWYVFGEYNPLYIRIGKIINKPVIIFDEKIPRALIRASDGVVLDYRESFFDIPIEDLPLALQ